MKKIIRLLICCLLFTSCINQPKTLGIDISHHNKLSDRDWEYFKKHDVKFVFIKASEGATFKDPARYEHFNKACDYRHDMHIGAYHFFRGDVPAEEQYRNYDKATDDMMIGLIPCIDYEKEGFGKESEISRIRNLVKLCDLFYEKSYARPLIYCNLIEYSKLKIFLPHNPFWIDSKSPDLGVGTVKQTVRKVNNKMIDFNYCKNMDDITFSD